MTTGEVFSGAGQWSATNRSQLVPEPTVTVSLLVFSLLVFSALSVAVAFKRKN